jgi:GST-like protein
VLKWFNTIAQRPAVEKGSNLFADLRKPITDEKAKAKLYGYTLKNQ